MPLSLLCILAGILTFLTADLLYCCYQWCTVCGTLTHHNPRSEVKFAISEWQWVFCDTFNFGVLKVQLFVHTQDHFQYVVFSELYRATEHTSTLFSVSLSGPYLRTVHP